MEGFPRTLLSLITHKQKNFCIKRTSKSTRARLKLFFSMKYLEKSIFLRQNINGEIFLLKVKF